jgi:hypothetical protein
MQKNNLSFDKTHFQNKPVRQRAHVVDLVKQIKVLFIRFLLCELPLLFMPIYVRKQTFSTCYMGLYLCLADILVGKTGVPGEKTTARG